MKIIKKISNKLKRQSIDLPKFNYEFGSSLPVPLAIKHSIIANYARQNELKVFVETGTFLGDTTKYVIPFFEEIYTIEVDDVLADRAAKRFANEGKVNVLKGDSGVLLNKVLNLIRYPALFWLDGHYSGGITGMGEKETPILEELKFILDHSIKNHVILIDDARCFTGEHDYPTLFEIYELFKQSDLRYSLNVKDDIIRITYR